MYWFYYWYHYMLLPRILLLTNCLTFKIVYMKHLIPQPQVVTIIVIIYSLAMLTSCGVANSNCPRGTTWTFSSSDTELINHTDDNVICGIIND